MDTISDSELVIRLQTNDVEAFNSLYQRYHQALYLNIFKLSRSANATEDILQEVFISLWEKRSTIDKNRPLSNWLFTVSFNKSVNYLKTSLRESVKLRHFAAGIDVSEEKEMTSTERKLLLIETATKHLSPQKSKVFVLCKVQGKTYEETAKELNLSKHTVKEYLSEAVSNIKEYINLHPHSSTVFFGATLLLTSF